MTIVIYLLGILNISAVILCFPRSTLQIYDKIYKVNPEKSIVNAGQDVLIENIDKIHTTEMGMDRIKRNLDLKDVDAVEWCREKILDKDAVITRQGKNWYVKICDNVITVNAKSYTIITAHKRK